MLGILSLEDSRPRMSKHSIANTTEESRIDNDATSFIHVEVPLSMRWGLAERR